LDNDRSYLGSAQGDARGDMQRESQPGAANQRAELGVWLVESGVPAWRFAESQRAPLLI
jgi:hypothetical protein